MTSDIEKWGDSQQYHAERHGERVDPTKGVEIKVNLLWMTPDPLGSLAAMCNMYEGKVVRSLYDVTDAQRKKALEDCMATHLKAPLEAVKLHFMIEGIDRAMTHQLVRQRTAVFAQESMRFAVVGSLAESTTLPPSLQGTDPDYVRNRKWVRSEEEQAHRWRTEWDRALKTLDEVYHYLVSSGMPAEEARGLLPHCTATRTNFVTDLRNLSDHAGNRLCTQAQFPWRILFAKIVEAIREHSWQVPGELSWQFEAIADSGLFRPVCYQIGRCPFNATFDRACSIRSRVEAKAKHGVPSLEWGEEQVLGQGNPPNGPVSEWGRDNEVGMVDVIPAINPAEWLANPGAARA